MYISRSDDTYSDVTMSRMSQLPCRIDSNSNREILSEANPDHLDLRLHFGLWRFLI